MTLKEENIVNIAMRAGELLMAGKMERDDITGHAGLTDTIIALAEAFEKKNAGVNFDAEGRDYWEEIDAFAEEHLLESYGIQQEPKDLQIKVILDEGIVSGVLKNDSIPVNVEIVDIFPDYEDYKALKDYRDQLFKDKSYSDCDYTVTRFDEEELTGHTQDIPEEEKVLVIPCVGNTEGAPIFSGTWDECHQFCEENSWTYWDENNFRWDLALEDPREALLPEGYYTAVEHFSDLAGADIENEFVRKHADKLVCCYENKLTLQSFDSWAKCEEILGETLTLGEYAEIEGEYDISSLGDPAYSPFLEEIKGKLVESREALAETNPKISLNEIISKADVKRNAQQPSLPGKDMDLNR